MSQERIVMAAWKEGSAIYVVERPGRHHTIAENLRDAGRLNTRQPLPHTSGFITSTGRYVDRKEGCEIARAAGQIVKKHGPDWELYSEDMW